VIFGRPTNLWLGTLTALFNVVVIANFPFLWDGNVVGAINIALAAVITLIANVAPSPGVPTLLAGKPAPK